ncbi:MAG: type III-A CRISPR-associated protein Csm2 [Balneolaceae bacterium]|nr:type III-A CRISPR-associated protein Csm2 [Balneolaceae bacterium]
MAYRQLEEIKKKIPQWIEEGFKSKGDMDLIEDFGKYLADARSTKWGGWREGRNAISTSQIRIAYGEVTRLKMQFDETAMLMLRPKMAYAASRQSSDAYKDLQIVITEGINSISNSDNKQSAFNNLANIFEAMLAYHKAYGGK